MIRDVGHPGVLRRIAINVGAGYLPGINTVIAGSLGIYFGSFASKK